MMMRKGVASFVAMMSLTAMLLPPGNALAADQQTDDDTRPPRSEWEAVKSGMLKNFRLSVGYSYGFIYTDAWAMPTQGKYGDVYHQLGLKQSTNIAIFSTEAEYTYTPKTDLSLPDFLEQPNFGFYLVIPFGLVQDVTGRTLPGLFDFDDLKFTVGDIYFGVNSSILQETRWIPHTNFSINVSAPASEYSSIGSGTWTVSPDLSLEKYLTDRFFLDLGVAYVFFFENNGVEQGNPLILKGGPGFLFMSGQLKAVLSVAYSKRSDLKLFDMPLETDTDNLSLALSFSEPTNRISFRVYFSGIDEGFDIEQNTFGFSLSLRVLPWGKQW